MLLPATYNTVASVHLMIYEFLRTSTITFAKIMNNEGPLMELCGMPQVNKPDSYKVL